MKTPMVGPRYDSKVPQCSNLHPRYSVFAHRGARINAQIPAGRMGTAEEVAAAALYLASAEGAYVTGQTLHVNGGMAMI